MNKLCLYCGKAIDGNSVFCNFCGKEQKNGGNFPNGGTRKHSKALLLIITLIAAGIWYIGNYSKNETSKAALVTSTPFIAKITTVPATIRPNMPMPLNGDVKKYTYKAHEAPFKVATPSGTEYYYIVLTESTDIKLKVISLIVYPGKTVEIDVPLGSYKMFYATGTKWYGKSDLFGEETRYYKAEDVLKFYKTSDQIMGITIELIKQVGGNLETTLVPWNILIYNNHRIKML